VIVSIYTTRPDCKRTYVDLGIVRQRGKRCVQRLVHLLSSSLKEASTTTNEKRVSSKHSAVISLLVLEQVADAVLGVARSVQSLDRDAGADAECLAVLWRRRHLSAVLAADDRDLVGLEHLLVAAGVVPVVVSVDDVGQLDAFRDLLLENGKDF